MSSRSASVVLSRGGDGGDRRSVLPNGIRWSTGGGGRWWTGMSLGSVAVVAGGACGVRCSRGPCGICWSRGGGERWCIGTSSSGSGCATEGMMDGGPMSGSAVCGLAVMFWRRADAALVRVVGGAGGSCGASARVFAVGIGVGGGPARLRTSGTCGDGGDCVLARRFRGLCTS